MTAPVAGQPEPTRRQRRLASQETPPPSRRSIRQARTAELARIEAEPPPPARRDRKALRATGTLPALTDLPPVPKRASIRPQAPGQPTVIPDRPSIPPQPKQQTREEALRAVAGRHLLKVTADGLSLAFPPARVDLTLQDRLVGAQIFLIGPARTLELAAVLAYNSNGEPTAFWEVEPEGGGVAPMRGPARRNEEWVWGWMPRNGYGVGTDIAAVVHACVHELLATARVPRPADAPAPALPQTWGI